MSTVDMSMDTKVAKRNVDSGTDPLVKRMRSRVPEDELTSHDKLFSMPLSIVVFGAVSSHGFSLALLSPVASLTSP